MDSRNSRRKITRTCKLYWQIVFRSSRANVYIYWEVPKQHDCVTATEVLRFTQDLHTVSEYNEIICNILALIYEPHLLIWLTLRIENISEENIHWEFT